MLCSDNFKEILINSDIETIKQLVHVNQEMKLFCNDSTFWKSKFIHDDLPIITDNFNTMDEWVNEYETILKCKNDCYNILLINKIMSQQIYNNSCRINIDYVNDKELRDETLPYYITGQSDMERIQIEYTSDDKYLIYYYKPYNHSNIDLLYNDVLNMLIKIMYYSLQDDNIKICDNLWNEPFLSDKEVEYNDSVDDYQLVTIQKQIIYQTLKTLNLLK